MSTQTWIGHTSDSWDTASNWSGNAIPVAGDTVVILPSSPPVELSHTTLRDETINIGMINGPVSNQITFADVKLADHTSFNVVSTQFPGSVAHVNVPTGSKLTVSDNSSMQEAGPGFLEVQGGGTLVNHGSISAGFGATELYLPNVINAGTMSTDFGVLAIGQTQADVFIGHHGLVTVSDGGQVLINAHLGNGETFAFGSLSPLNFPNIISFAETNVHDPINGFGPGDEIILAHVTADDFVYHKGTLTVTNQGSVVGQLDLPGVTASALHIAPTTPNDPVNGIAITVTAAV